MAANRTDMYWLSQDPSFQKRCQTSFVDRCNIVQTEGFSVVFHRERQKFAVQALANPQAFANTVAQVYIGTATDSLVISDATVGGTIHLVDGATAATGAVLVTDAHIDAAISGQFNTWSLQP